MSRGAEQYNWAAYYAAVYEKARKENIVLAERIADAERRQADLQDNLDRICATPFWKMTVPFRRLVRIGYNTCFLFVKVRFNFLENSRGKQASAVCEAVLEDDGAFPAVS